MARLLAGVVMFITFLIGWNCYECGDWFGLTACGIFFIASLACFLQK